jgi:signal transduction histidine kinase/DNA-binding response OmpR family regulator
MPRRSVIVLNCESIEQKKQYGKLRLLIHYFTGIRSSLIRNSYDRILIIGKSVAQGETQMIKKVFERSADLAYLRSESLQPVLFVVMVALYLWYLVLFQPINQVGTGGWGLVLLAGGLVIAFFTRKRSVSFASAALILSIAASILYTMGLTDITAAPYLLVVAVSLTGLLFSLKVVMGVTILCSSAVMVVGSLYWGHSPFSSELLAPVLVIVLVGTLSSLTVRNLYLTLYWAWDRTMAVQHNEEKLLDRQGELARALKALDVAYKQLEHLNYDLARARAAAEEARRAKEQFATHISHELRTPLNVIMAFSEMMYLSPGSYGQAPLPSAYRGDIREIYRSSKHLLKLIEDVLRLSRTGSSEMRIQPEPTELHQVVTEALGVIRPLLRGKNVELRAELPRDLPSVVVDRARIGQVLLNLLNNARRFTEQGSITVQATLEAGRVKVTVADTGIGIPPAELHQVFKEFRQLEGSVSLHQDGSGLGLAISKRFIELHGGRIWAESEGAGRGSCFHFTLPLQEPHFFEAGSREALPFVRTPTGRGRTILLLDQDSFTVQILKEGLKDCQVVTVKSVLEVPSLISETHPRAVVLNLTRKSEAWQQMVELREQLGSSSLPIILCSLVGPQHLGHALRVKDYLVKPITREALVALLHRLDMDIRRILVIDDDPRMVNLLARLLQADTREYEISWAKNGQEGLSKMQEQPTDLVLMDLNMPQMDGYSLLGQMQQDPDLCCIPVVVVTAHTGSPEEERRLGGRSLFISNQAGFTNDEVLNYLRHILNAVAAPWPLPHANQAVQGSQQVGLDNGFPQVGSSAQ